MSACIRLATPADAEGIQAIYAPIVRDTIVSFELEPPSVEEMQSRIVATLERFPWLVCGDGGVVAGYAYASAHRTRAAYQWAVDVSVYNHEAYRARGVGRALYAPLLAILRAQGFQQACAGIALPNEASVGLHEAMGFLPVGVYEDIGYKLGAWHPVGWWQAGLGGRPDGSPRPPTALPNLDRAIVEAALAAGTVLLRV